MHVQGIQWESWWKEQKDHQELDVGIGAIQYCESLALEFCFVQAVCWPALLRCPFPPILILMDMDATGAFLCYIQKP